MREHLCLQALFKGTVQGVGFRFYTEKIAARLGLVGYVRNLPDGTVEVVAEGKKNILEKFLDEMASGYLSRYIRGIEKSWKHPTGEFKDFGIRF